MNSFFHRCRKLANLSILAMKKGAWLIAKDMKYDWEAGYIPKATYPFLALWFGYWVVRIRYHIDDLVDDLRLCEECAVVKRSEGAISKCVINHIVAPRSFKKVEVEIFGRNNGKKHLIALEPGLVIIRENEKDHQYPVNSYEDRVIRHEINKKLK